MNKFTKSACAVPVCVDEICADGICRCNVFALPGTLLSINAQFEVVSNGITGSTDAKIKRIESRDDGALSVIIDHWPELGATLDRNMVLEQAVRACESLCVPYADIATIAYNEAIQDCVRMIRKEKSIVPVDHSQSGPVTDGIAIAAAAKSGVFCTMPQAIEFARLIISHNESSEDDKLCAERYRWLRDDANFARRSAPMVCINPIDDAKVIVGDDMDNIVDNEMRIMKGSK